jgi:hypothetical protein
MYILYDFVCYDLFHILLSYDKIMDPWNVYMYVCMYVSLEDNHFWNVTPCSLAGVINILT